METIDFKTFAETWLSERVKSFELIDVSITLNRKSITTFTVSALLDGNVCIGKGFNQQDAVKNCLAEMKQYAQTDVRVVYADMPRPKYGYVAMFVG